MPIYDYECTCGETKEVLQRMSDPPPTCINCGSSMKKKIAGSSFQLKGEGWAKDLYHKKEK